MNNNIIHGYKGVAKLFFELSGRHICTRTIRRMVVKFRIPYKKINHTTVEFELDRVLKTEFTKHAYKKQYKVNR